MDLTLILLISFLVLAMGTLSFTVHQLISQIRQIPEKIHFHATASWADADKLISAVQDLRMGMAEGDYADLVRRMNDLEVHTEKRWKKINAEVHGLGTEKTQKPVIVPMENPDPQNGIQKPDPESNDPRDLFPDYQW